MRQPRGPRAFGQDVADFHVVIDSERAGDDVRAVEFFADDTAADGIAVEANHHVEEGGAVADDDFLVDGFGA